MDRKFTVRTNGLYKKANTLFNMLGSKVAILVQTHDGTSRGYVSHESQDWPDLYRALGVMGLEPRDFLRPDHFDTVADRNRRRPLSFSSSSLSATTSAGGSFVDHDDSDRQMIEMLASVMEEPASSDEPGPSDVDQPHSTSLTGSQFSSLPSTSSAPSATQTAKPYADFLLAAEPQAGRSEFRHGARSGPETANISIPGTEWAPNGLDLVHRRIKISTDASDNKRKRRSDLGHGDKRRRIVTRSQGNEPIGRRH